MVLPGKFRVALVALIALVAVGAWAVARTGEGTSGPAVPLSGPMPPLAGEAVNGSDIEPSLYRGRAVVVNFWASWCAPCRREQPGLQRLWEEYRGRGVRFVGVNHIDRLDDARAFVERFGVTYPSVHDPEGRWASAFSIPYLPATVLVGPDGSLRYRLPGEQDAATIERYLNEVLAG